MQTRLDFSAVQTANQALQNIGKFVDECGLERSLLDLMLIRASQSNRWRGIGLAVCRC